VDRQLDDRIALAFAALAASSERNRLYAALAKKQGLPQRARLLDAIAKAEKTQASRLLMALRGKVGPADTYYNDLLQRKQTVSSTVAPQIQQGLEAENNRYGAEFFGRLTRVSKNHARLLEKDAGTGTDRKTIFHVCRVCGFISVNKIPDKCPVCNAVPKKFTSV
jgi:rubrerythrin